MLDILKKDCTYLFFLFLWMTTMTLFYFLEIYATYSINIFNFLQSWLNHKRNLTNHKNSKNKANTMEICTWKNEKGNLGWFVTLLPTKSLHLSCDVRGSFLTSAWCTVENPIFLLNWLRQFLLLTKLSKFLFWVKISFILWICSV